LLYSGRAHCTTCHAYPHGTEPGLVLHSPAEVGIDDFQANRSPTERLRTTPLRGLWTHANGGFYHDGRFRTLADVVTHYDKIFTLRLEDEEKHDRVEFLKSL